MLLFVVWISVGCCLESRNPGPKHNSASALFVTLTHFPLRICMLSPAPAFSVDSLVLSAWGKLLQSVWMMPFGRACFCKLLRCCNTGNINMYPSFGVGPYCCVFYSGKNLYIIKNTCRLESFVLIGFPLSPCWQLIGPWNYTGQCI